jgi:hypothetical protein
LIKRRAIQLLNGQVKRQKKIYIYREREKRERERRREGLLRGKKYRIWWPTGKQACPLEHTLENQTTKETQLAATTSTATTTLLTCLKEF